MALKIPVKWSGAEYEVEVLDSDTVTLFKQKIFEVTQVRPERQKLLNLKHNGKPPLDDVPISALGLKPGFKVMMMGSREETIEQAISKPENLPEVVDDFDIPDEADVEVKDRKVFLEKVERRVREYKGKILNEPRPGKKLLVLDIDYTLFDHRSTGETGSELMRPYLHEFLTDSYEHYDIVIWSATSMKWIEEKMKLLGVASNTNYKILAYMDDLAMITVVTDKYGVVNVKPLGVIWGQYPQYGPKNTIMFDDCRHNFLMNPQSGLRIKAFRDAHFTRSSDKELLYLAKYLRAIASLDTFEALNHRNWRDFLRDLKKKRRRYEATATSGDVDERIDD